MLAHDANGATAPVIYPGASQSVAFSSTSATSNPMGVDTTVVRLVAQTADCRVLFGAVVNGVHPVALSTSMLIKKDVPEYFAIKPGDEVAVIREGADNGTLNITEGANH